MKLESLESPTLNLPVASLNDAVIPAFPSMLIISAIVTSVISVAPAAKVTLIIPLCVTMISSEPAGIPSVPRLVTELAVTTYVPVTSSTTALQGTLWNPSATSKS